MPAITKYEKESETTVSALPGRYTLVNATLTKSDGQVFDLLSKLARFNVYESLHTAWLTADLDLIDTVNIPRIAKLSGGEKIKIAVTDCRGEPRTFDLIFTSITDKKAKSASSWRYKMHAVSENYFRSHLDLVSRSFVNKRPEQIIEYLLKKEMNFDSSDFYYAESASNTCCVFPNWRATFAAQWLTTKAESAIHPGSPWRLFMDVNQDIYFVPVELLYRSDHARKKTLYIQGMRKADALVSSRVVEQEFMFERLELVDTASVLSNLRNGMFKSKIQAIDLANRVESSEEFDYNDSFNELEHLGDVPAEVDGFDIANPRIKMAPVHLGLFSQDSAIDNSAKIAAEYESKNQQTKLVVARGILPGTNKLRVGQKYNVDIPDYSNSKLDKPDSRLSGDFVIEQIKHSYGADDQYRAIVQMYRDAFSEESA